LRRLQSPEVAAFLADSDPYLVREAALAINDAPINAALPALAAMLDKPLTDEPVIFRALNAHFRLGQPANANALANYAARKDAPPKARAEALARLAEWPKPLQRDRLVGIYRPLPEKTRDRAVVAKAIERLAPNLLAPGTPSVVQSAALTAMQNLAIAGAAKTLFAVVSDENQSGETRAAALTALDKIKDPRLAEAVKIAGASKSSELSLAALPIASRLSPEAAAPVLANLVNQGTLDERKAAYRTLGFSKLPSADAVIADQLRQLAAGKVPAGVQLELLSAAERRRDPKIKQLLAARDAELAKTTDTIAPYRYALEGGSATRGRQIFENQPTLACIRCHRASAGGGDAGPNLAEVGAKHDREYILESIVKPNAKIAPGFDTVVVTLKSGGSAAGIVASETSSLLTLRNTDNKLVEVKKSEIAKREGAPSGMPEIYASILTKRELRDVVEYLASLKEAVTRLDENKPRALRGLPRPTESQ
jgi:putative heme-binding domain-containing protein